MLKIGEFSRLSQVTVKTLHHYSDLGLLKPAKIDPQNNYRYYTVEQLPRIHRIMALKELGLSLEQIGLMLDEDLPTDQIRGMLRYRRAEIHQQAREAQKQLATIEFHLRMIEAEINFPVLDVIIKRLAAMRFLSFFVGPHPTLDDGEKVFSTVVNGLNQSIEAGLIQHTGVTIDVFHGKTILPFESPDLHDRQHEILLGVTEDQGPVTIEGIGELSIREEPAVEQAATLVLTSEESDLEGYEKVILLRRWAIAHDYQPGKLVRFFHHLGPLQTYSRDEWIVEAQLPLEPGS